MVVSAICMHMYEYVEIQFEIWSPPLRIYIGSLGRCVLSSRYKWSLSFAQLYSTTPSDDFSVAHLVAFYQCIARQVYIRLWMDRAAAYSYCGVASEREICPEAYQ